MKEEKSILQRILDDTPEEKYKRIEKELISRIPEAEYLVENHMDLKEFLTWLCNEPAFCIEPDEIDEIIQDYSFYKSQRNE